jgi:hypothetical protein
MPTSKCGGITVVPCATRANPKRSTLYSPISQDIWRKFALLALPGTLDAEDEAENSKSTDSEEEMLGSDGTTLLPISNLTSLNYDEERLINPEASISSSGKELRGEAQLFAAADPSMGNMGDDLYRKDENKDKSPGIAVTATDSFFDDPDVAKSNNNNGDAVSLPEINIQLAPPSRQAGFGPAKEEGKDDALSPPDRSKFLVIEQEYE